MSASEGFEEQVLAKLAELDSRLHRPRPRHSWVGRFVKGLGDDPRVQIRVHKVACVYWLINFPVVGLLFFGFPKVWLGLGLLINTFYSLYANLATDYDGLSSAQASLHAREATQAASVSNEAH
jgi:hypothetical protein